MAPEVISFTPRRTPPRDRRAIIVGIPMRLQRLVPIRQNFPDRALPDVRRAVLEEMRAAAWAQAPPAGARIAIGVGSRGIANIAVMAKAVVDFWIERGCP